ncbi:hypothetical protein Pd630_LPD11008 (plasmid) [Rhodococcus opacus PD630]|nr:hypothetical protein Pd630_LPD11008 [Rhodococcus opacus PD630]
MTVNSPFTSHVNRASVEANTHVFSCTFTEPLRGSSFDVNPTAGGATTGSLPTRGHRCAIAQFGLPRSAANLRPPGR